MLPICIGVGTMGAPGAGAPYVLIFIIISDSIDWSLYTLIILPLIAYGSIEPRFTKPSSYTYAPSPPFNY